MELKSVTLVINFIYKYVKLKRCTLFYENNVSAGVINLTQLSLFEGEVQKAKKYSNN